RRVILWDVASGKALHTLERHTDSVNSVTFSPDGRRALSGGSDHTVRLWDLERGREVRRLAGHQDIVWAVAFAPGGRRAAPGGGSPRNPDGAGFIAGRRAPAIRLWDLAEGTVLRSLEGHPEAVGALAFSPDGRRLLSGDNAGGVRLWQLETGKEVKRFAGHT